MEAPLLRDQNTLPTKDVLEHILGESYFVYNELTEIVTSTKFGLVTEWRFYNDGKAWLYKAIYKKKTIFWLSVWDKYFKLGFYFTEKTGKGIAELDIEEKIKEEFNHSKSFGKLIPLAIKMIRKEQIEDVLRIVEYKKRLK